ncbi:MAG: glycosyltransferase [Gammaproteobacteria bacterium]|nr:MAG: glycosyltransferase [Gammaproteobacteria bacterium]
MDMVTMRSKSILIMIHCDENTGYAIASLEYVFLEAAKKAGFAEKNIFWSFKKIITKDSSNIVECNYVDPHSYGNVEKLIRDNNIQTALAFDLGFPCALIPVLKKAGIKNLISYWGASMSSINFGVKLQLKRLECLLTVNKPDFFIFESEAMRKTATHGRGLHRRLTSIVYLGVDTDKFYPMYDQDYYLHDVLNIPRYQKIIFYSGHMEERKGVRVITNAAIHLIDKLNYSNIHFVICGNKNHEADAYEKLLENTKARHHVTFAGYRADVPELMRSSYIGVIASTGWDSFTMSSIEMMASGLPLIVSNLQGLSETIADNKNGFLIEPGNHIDLAKKIETLIEQPNLAKSFSKISRQRAKSLFAIDIQIEEFSKIFMKNA